MLFNIIVLLHFFDRFFFSRETVLTCCDSRGPHFSVSQYKTQNRFGSLSLSSLRNLFAAKSDFELNKYFVSLPQRTQQQKPFRLKLTDPS